MSVKDLILKPIPGRIASKLIVENHYSHAWPAGGGRAPFGVFCGDALRGCIVYSTGACPQTHLLVEGTSRFQYLELTRLWLHDSLGKNAESRVIALSIRLLKRHAPWLKWLISYADPNVGHQGTIYQATNWLYTGLGAEQPQLVLDGKVTHRRTVSNRYGSSERGYLKSLGIKVETQEVLGKHRYIYFLDPSWRPRLRLPVLPYPG